MVPFGVGQAEQPFLKDRIPSVPQRDRKTPAHMEVAEPADPVLAPAVGSATRMIMRQIVPGIAVCAVVFAHGAPLPLAEIRSPMAPLACVARVIDSTALDRIEQVCRVRRTAFRHHIREAAFRRGTFAAW